MASILLFRKLFASAAMDWRIGGFGPDSCVARDLDESGSFSKESTALELDRCSTIAPQITTTTTTTILSNHLLQISLPPNPLTLLPTKSSIHAFPSFIPPLPPSTNHQPCISIEYTGGCLPSICSAAPASANFFASDSETKSLAGARLPIWVMRERSLCLPWR